MSTIEVEVWSSSTGAGWCFRVESETFRLTLNHTAADQTKTSVFKRTFEDFDSLELAYRSEFKKLLSTESLFDSNNRDVTRPKDLRRAIERAKELERFKATAPAPELPDPRLVRARALLAEASLTPAELKRIEAAMGFATTLEDLAAGFHVVLEIERLEESVLASAGGSKIGGAPDLPKGARTPRGHEFLAQLDLADISAWDLEHQLPPTGRLFVFVKETGFGKAVFSTAPAVARKAASTKPLCFIPRYSFAGVDKPVAVADALPPALRGALEDVFEGAVTALSCERCERIFGQPTDFQMEGDAVWRSADDDEAVELIAQLEYGEGFVLVGGDAEQAYVAYSGT